jgi:hypothetical protein
MRSRRDIQTTGHSIPSLGARSFSKLLNRPTRIVTSGPVRSLTRGRGFEVRVALFVQIVTKDLAIATGLFPLDNPLSFIMTISPVTGGFITEL